MRTISLRGFSREAPQLQERVLITHESSIIGTFVPISDALDDRATAGVRPGEPPSRDLLGGSFGTSRPAPKPGKKP